MICFGVGCFNWFLGAGFWVFGWFREKCILDVFLCALVFG